MFFQESQCWLSNSRGIERERITANEHPTTLMTFVLSRQELPGWLFHQLSGQSAKLMTIVSLLSEFING